MFIQHYEQELEPFGATEDLLRIRKTKEVNSIKCTRNIWFVSNQEIQQLRQLNTFLTEFEFQLRADIEDAIKQAKITYSPFESLTFEELEVYLYFYLAKNDPEYCEDKDNLILILKYWFNGNEKWEHGITDGENHNTIIGRKDHTTENDHHCSLMHVLYDDTDLSWDEILRIGSIDYRFNVVLESRQDRYTI